MLLRARADSAGDEFGVEETTEGRQEGHQVPVCGFISGAYSGVHKEMVRLYVCVRVRVRGCVPLAQFPVFGLKTELTLKYCFICFIFVCVFFM